MKHFIPLSGAILAVAHVGSAFGAEDHSAHRLQATQEAPASNEHAEHQGHEMPAATDEHAHHQNQATQQPTESELRHVPPAPPQLTVTHTSNEAMIELMQMEDNAKFGKVLFDQVEWSEEDTLSWDAQAWYGDDYNKLWLKSEGEHLQGEEEGNVELLWDRVIARWWDIQAGVRHDFGAGPSRTWAAFGVQGLAPYWFEVEATVYVGDEGRSAARLVGEYELLLTQRWILQPKMELNLYGKEDAENHVGSGLSEVEVGLRLRYEIRREFAPYLGVAWSRRFGSTADFVRDAGEDTNDVQLVAGLRIWF